jgi:pimeloyl-ACP methyl ester carboxylesterase
LWSRPSQRVATRPRLPRAEHAENILFAAQANSKALQRVTQYVPDKTPKERLAQQAEIADRRIEQPASFIAGSLDPVLSFLPGVDLVALMRERVTDLRLVRIIDGAGHWVQQERPAEVNAALLEFLGGLA